MSPFGTLPHSIITTSILPFVTTDDWLSFRGASRGSFEIVHGTTNVSFSYCSMCQPTTCSMCDSSSVGTNRGTNDRSYAESEALWKIALVKDYQFERPSDEKRGTRASDTSQKYDLMTSIHSPMNERGRQRILASDLDEPEAKLSALKAVYAFYAGQNGDERTDQGLFGGVFAYNFGRNMHWERWTCLHFGNADKTFLVSSDALEILNTLVCMDLSSGQLEIFQGSTFVPATPHQSEDAILLWFEEHARRLDIGYYEVGKLSQDDDEAGVSLLQYPSIVDTVNCSRAVTRGVEVVSSAVFCPHDNMFIYSIRMRLLTPEDGVEYQSEEERGFISCQLRSRHWRITKQSRVEEVRGDGVVGEYPLLIEGSYASYNHEGADALATASNFEKGYFTYQSCCEGTSRMLEGYLHFIPGTLEVPTGATFAVRVAPFSLNNAPEFYY
eukprot:scaffold353_cov201-Alexandrium_tamarense.AAC.5